MKTRSFLAFVAPSVASMLILIALPLVGVAYLSLHQSRVKTELVELTTEIPLVGGLTRKQTRVVPQSVLDEDGMPIQIWEYVGGRNLAKAGEFKGIAKAIGNPRGGSEEKGYLSRLYRDITNFEFWAALEFTLLYTFLTTPAILIVGLALALAVNSVSKRLRGTLVFATLLPMIVTPVVSSLAIYWLFMDNAIITNFIEYLGFGKFYFLADKITIRTLIILYGVWFAAPFAFIILYAGLQTMPRDPLESAMIDGANKWQRLRYVIIPHLGPLLTVITLIHVMDAYRVFEPILVFNADVFANSVQYLTYFALAFQDNIHKAAAYSILTIVGVIILLIPVLRKSFREYRIKT
ncbi:MAG: sugar ABC transporter permease [Albidovulum sp.]|nr:sugar ABC transporter permease [Albidovulum sp.]MDE0307707.1 sugar ABC transporter permease [Albidovulum sp.]MDE0532119.1 sugar ABC transporter permease [Albidovulum sp.]